MAFFLLRKKKHLVAEEDNAESMSKPHTISQTMYQEDIVYHSFYTEMIA